jgi:sugar lactone lactonase YvrE
MGRKVLAAILAIAASSAGRTQAHPAWGIALDNRGRVVFADVDHGNHIWRIDSPNKLSSLVTGRHSHDLHLGHDGTLFVAHVFSNPRSGHFESQLLKFGPDGTSSQVIAPTPDRKRFWGNAFTLDRDGNVYFGYTNNPRAGETEDESLLLKRAPDGRVTVLAGSIAGLRDGWGNTARFKSINALVFGPSDVLYVADESAIRKVGRDGAVTTLARDLLPARAGARQAGNDDHLYGLAVAEDGTAYAADFAGHRVVKVSSRGRTETAFESEPNWAPTGVAVSAHDLYILEVGSRAGVRPSGPRVRKISPGGHSEVLATVGD